MSKDNEEAPGEAPVAGREILNIDEAAALLGVSVKTFNKVLHAEDIPGRKVGREWKFSRHALIEWVGSGRSRNFYREANGRAGAGEALEDREVRPAERGGERSAERASDRIGGEKTRSRRTAGWQIELD